MTQPLGCSPLSCSAVIAERSVVVTSVANVTAVVPAVLRIPRMFSPLPEPETI